MRYAMLPAETVFVCGSLGGRTMGTGVLVWNTKFNCQSTSVVAVLVAPVRLSQISSFQVP